MEIEKIITVQSATIIVAIIGALASCLTFTFGKMHEKKIELRRIKEEQYIDFLSSLARAKAGDSIDKVNEDLSIRIQIIYLVGNKDVQLKLQNFLDYLSNKDNIQMDQNKLYGQLIQSMKLDLYGRKWKISSKAVNSLDKISFVVFADNKK